MIFQKLSRAVLFAVLVASYTNALSQESPTHGWMFALGSGEPVLMEDARDGAPSVALKQNINFGIHYLRRIHQNVYVETGVAFTTGKMTVTASPNPDIPFREHSHNLQMLNIPLFVRLVLSKHFFVNAGLLADIDVSSKPYIAAQSEIGSGISLGGQISLSEKVTLSLAPYIQLHNLLSWEGSTHRQRVAEAGFRLGITVWKE